MRECICRLTTPLGIYDFLSAGAPIEYMINSEGYAVLLSNLLRRCIRTKIHGRTKCIRLGLIEFSTPSTFLVFLGHVKRGIHASG